MFSIMNGVRHGDGADVIVFVFTCIDNRFSRASAFVAGAGAGSNFLRMRKSSMMKTIAIAAALAFGLATASQAAMMPLPVGHDSDLTIKVAEGCGPGFWRGPHGVCHPMAVNRACPRGFHLGPEGRRCWPN
jgi:hypothetical protein